jgi:hypothetical protein
MKGGLYLAVYTLIHPLLTMASTSGGGDGGARHTFAEQLVVSVEPDTKR